MVEAPGFAEQDGWQVQVQALIQRKAGVLVKAGGLSHEQLRAAHFEPVTDVGMAVRQALGDGGRRRDAGGPAPRPADDSLPDVSPRTPRLCHGDTGTCGRNLQSREFCCA